MIDDTMRRQASGVLDACRSRGFKVVTAESCTGGLVAGTLTEVPGSSDVVDRGFVTYSNAAKEAMLGVRHETLEAHGAVSAETAVEMAKGALARSNAHLSVSITGVAGPGASLQKPVGLVYFCACARDGRVIEEEKRFGAIGREQVRAKSVQQALTMLQQLAAGRSGERTDQY